MIGQVDVVLDVVEVPRGHRNPNASNFVSAAQFVGTDVDNFDTVTWSSAGTGVYGSFTLSPLGQWSYMLDNSRAATNALQAGQSVQERFTISLTDSHGAVAQQDFVVTIAGANDTPVVTGGIAFGQVREDDASAATAQGTLFATDPEGSAITWQYITGTPLNSNTPVNAGTYGRLTMDSSGAWQYNLDNSLAATQSLGEGQQATETFTLRAVDAQGAVTSTVITILVVGSAEPDPAG